MPRRALLYARISVSEPGSPKVGNQLADCRALCAREGYEVAAEFSDDGISASKFAHRPGWVGLLEALEAGRGDVVVAVSADRLTRQPAENLQLLDTADKAGALIHTLAGVTDPGSPEGEFRSGMDAQLARFEARKKADRQRLANEHRRLSGEASKIGRRPFGWEEDRVTPRPVEAQLIRDVTEAVLARPQDDRGLYLMRAMFNASGLPTARGTRVWSFTSCLAVMQNPKHAALVSHTEQYVKPNGSKARRVHVLREVEAKWPAIVPVERWDALQARLAPRGDGRRTRPPQWVATGLARCSVCGGPLVVGSGSSHQKSGSKRVPNMLCRNRQGTFGDGKRHPSIRPHLMEQAVRAAVLDTYMTSPQGGGVAAAADLAALSDAYRRRDEAREALARLVTAVASGAVSTGEVAPQAALLREAEATAVADAARIESTSAHARMVGELSDWITRPTRDHDPADPMAPESTMFTRAVEVRRELGERWDAMPVEDRRLLARALLKVTLHPGTSPDRIDIVHLGAPALDVDEQEAS